MAEMVDTVAMAMVVPAHEFQWDFLNSEEQDDYRLKATASITAMRTPTDAMLTAAAGLATPLEIWQAMIDQALV